MRPKRVAIGTAQPIPAPDLFAADDDTIQDLIMMEKTTYMYCQGNLGSCNLLDRHVSYTDLYAHLVEQHGISMPLEEAIDVFENISSSAEWADEP